MHVLDLRGIAISTGAACHSQSVEISHVLKTIGMDEFFANGSVRISFGINDEDDASVITAKEIVTHCRKTQQNTGA